MKICAIDKLQVYVKFPISIFNSESFHLKTEESFKFPYPEYFPEDKNFTLLF